MTVDYDKTEIPSVYDRARARSPKMLGLWIDAVAARPDRSEAPKTIVDLGCGTGRFSAPLRTRFGCQVIGLDPSAKMLRQACGKLEADSICYVVARGEDIPLSDESVDLIFMSMVFHHFTEPERVVSECHRVLTRGGGVFLRAGTAERIGSYPMTPYFPPAVPIMKRVLADATAISGLFESEGFDSVAADALEQEVAPTHATYADNLEAGADSVLAQLSKGEFQAGLRALRSEAVRVDPKPVKELIDFFWFTKAS